MEVEDLRRQLATDPVASFLWRESREGMAFVDPEGVMRVVNPRFAELLGYSSSELQDRTFASITVGDDVGPDTEEFGKLLRGEIPAYTMTKTYNTKSRQTLTVRLRAVSFERGCIVMGQILPVDALSIESLPPRESKHILAMLAAKWVMDNPKKSAAAFMAVASMFRLDDLLAILK